MPVYTIFGHVGIEEGVRFTEEMIKAYVKREPVSSKAEAKMCFFTQVVKQFKDKTENGCLMRVEGAEDLSLRRKSAVILLWTKSFNICIYI